MCCMEFPKVTYISQVLEERGQLNIILDKVEEINQKREIDRKASMTQEEKAIEEAKWEIIRNDPDPDKFYGNMDQPKLFKNLKIDTGFTLQDMMKMGIERFYRSL